MECNSYGPWLVHLLCCWHFHYLLFVCVSVMVKIQELTDIFHTVLYIDSLNYFTRNESFLNILQFFEFVNLEKNCDQLVWKSFTFILCFLFSCLNLGWILKNFQYWTDLNIFGKMQIASSLDLNGKSVWITW